MHSDPFMEEDRGLRDFDHRLAWRLLLFLKPYTGAIAASSVLSLAMALLQLAGPYIVKITIDTYIAARDMAGVMRMCALFAATTLALFFLEYMQALLIARVGQHAMFDLRARIFGHVQTLPLSFFDRNPVGRLMTRITSDVATLNELFSLGVMTLAGDIFLLVSITALMFHTNVVLTALLFVTGPLLFYAGNIFRRNVRAAHRDVRAWLSRMNACLQENLSGMRTVQAYNRQERNFEQFSGLNREYLAANMRSVLCHAIFFPVVELLGAMAIALIVWYGGGQVIAGAMTLGTVYLFVQYAQRFFQPIRDLSEKFNIFQTAMASAERVFKLLETQPDIVSPPSPVPFHNLREDIRFEDVWFAYKDEEWVLRGVTLQIRKGEKVALVGATGSGKTTMTSLVARFYDVQKGTVMIDGVDVRSLDLKQLRSRMAIVLQDVFLFTGSVASNIRLGNEAIGDARLEECARVVNAHPFISALPDAYEHPVRERGATFSVGQKQLLAFARALAFDPEILILDEATASIDTETELLIQQAIERLLVGRTAIIVAHRLSTIQHCDRIVVLHRGKIRESGTHAELLANDGIYRKLYELQYQNLLSGAPQP